MPRRGQFWHVILVALVKGRDQLFLLIDNGGDDAVREDSPIPYEALTLGVGSRAWQFQIRYCGWKEIFLYANLIFTGHRIFYSGITSSFSKDRLGNVTLNVLWYQYKDQLALVVRSN